MSGAANLGVGSAGRDERRFAQPDDLLHERDPMLVQQMGVVDREHNRPVAVENRGPNPLQRVEAGRCRELVRTHERREHSESNALHRGGGDHPDDAPPLTLEHAQEIVGQPGFADADIADEDDSAARLLEARRRQPQFLGTTDQRPGTRFHDCPHDETPLALVPTIAKTLASGRDDDHSAVPRSGRDDLPDRERDVLDAVVHLGPSGPAQLSEAGLGRREPDHPFEVGDGDEQGAVGITLPDHGVHLEHRTGRIPGVDARAVVDDPLEDRQRP